MKWFGVLLGILTVSAQAQVIITLRGIEYSKDRHEQWSNIATSDTNSLYLKLVEDIKKNHARDAEVISVAVNAGKKATIESIVEIMYPCEREPSSMGSLSGAGGASLLAPEAPKLPMGFTNLSNPFTLPPIPPAFVPRNTGSTLEVTSNGHEKHFHSITLNYEYVRLVGWDQFTFNASGKGINYGDQPKFIKRALNISISLQEGTWQFIGFRDAWSKDSAVGDKVAFFVRVDAIR